MSPSLQPRSPALFSSALGAQRWVSKIRLQHSSREAAATIQKEGHCSVNLQWGTPKTPAPSGPLTLYVGPSRDAGRLRARQDRHRAAAPALSNGDGLSKQTHSAVLARALRGSGRVALSRPPVDRSAGERPTILGSLQNVVSLSPVGGDVPSSGGHVDRLLGQSRDRLEVPF